MTVSGVGGHGLCGVRDHINDFRLHIKGTWVLEREGEGGAMLKEPGENSRGYSIYSHNYMLLRNNYPLRTH